MAKVVITQSNYIPWKGYFDAINQSDVFVIYDDMQFTKRDWRNRNTIKTANGIKWLTIPVEVKGKYFQKINETKIADKNWNIDHWNVIKQSYLKSKNFKEYKDFFEDLYLKTTETYLTEVNFKFITAICDLLKIETKFHFSSEFELKEERSERLLDICLQLNATNYLSGPAAKNYMNEKIFEEAGVEINYFDYSNFPTYKQLYEPFDHNVSILDLLFCEGKNAINLFKPNQNG